MLYAILDGKRLDSEILISSLAQGQASAGTILSVELLDGKKPLAFSQDATGLHVNLAKFAKGDSAYVLKIMGLKMNSITSTRSGNPMTNNGVGQR